VAQCVRSMAEDGWRGLRTTKTILKNLNRFDRQNLYRHLSEVEIKLKRQSRSEAQGNQLFFFPSGQRLWTQKLRQMFQVHFLSKIKH